jgi:hypothetical protein
MEARLVASMADIQGIAVRFLHEAVASMGAVAGALNVAEGEAWRNVATVGPWTGRTELAVPISGSGGPLALVLLGPRADGAPYDQADADALAAIAPDVGRALEHLPVSAGAA